MCIYICIYIYTCHYVKHVYKYIFRVINWMKILKRQGKNPGVEFFFNNAKNKQEICKVFNSEHIYGLGSMKHARFILNVVPTVLHSVL